MEWINVEDRLPKFHAIVQIKRKNGEVSKAYYHDDKMSWICFYHIKTTHFQDMNGKWLDDVTHWKKNE